MMSATIAKTVAGVYLFEDGDCIEADRFGGDAADIAEHLTGTHPLEEQFADAERTVLPADEIADRTNMSVEDVYRLQREVAQYVTTEKIRAAGSRDQLLVQAVRALDDLNEMNNDKSERLRPWFALHFPELEEEITDNEELARIVSDTADRDKLREYADLADRSTGIPIDETDAHVLQLFATHLNNAYRMRDDIEQYVENMAHEVAPNLNALLGGLLAARIVSLAGSLEKLAKMPASTIQVLGAEKAMFRHMRGEGAAPKHGALFMHPFVQQVSADNQGEMARALANKAAIAARLDQYGGEFKGGSLHGEVEERFNELQS